MSSIDHLHVEAEILNEKEHSELLSAQYLVRCLEPENIGYSITTRDTPKRRMWEMLFTRHRNTVEPMILADVRKATLQAIHTDVVLLLSTNSLDPCLWRSPIIPLLVHQPAYLPIWPAAPSLQRGLSTNPGVTMWCVCGCS